MYRSILLVVSCAALLITSCASNIVGASNVGGPENKTWLYIVSDDKKETGAYRYSDDAGTPVRKRARVSGSGLPLG